MSTRVVPAMRMLASAGSLLAPNLLAKRDNSNISCEIKPDSHQARPWFARAISPSLNQDQIKIQEFRQQEEYRKEKQRITLHQLIQSKDEAEERALKAQIDGAKVRVDNALLRKSNEELKAEVQTLQDENRKHQTQIRLGETRLQKVLRNGKSRRGEIAWALMQACPSLDTEDAILLASGIDTFEEFDKPDMLYTEKTSDQVLRVYFGSKTDRRWRINYGLNRLDCDEGEKLLTAVRDEIDKQKTLFPVRLLVRNICMRHLGDFPSIDEGVMNASQLVAAIDNSENQDVMVKTLKKDAVDRFEAVFRDMLDQQVDVDAVLLSSWLPFVMHRASWTYTFLNRVHADGLRNPSRVEIGAADTREDMMTLWKLAQEHCAADTREDMMTLWKLAQEHLFIDEA